MYTRTCKVVGYLWRTSPKRQFEILPVDFNYVRLTQTSEEFDEYLNQFPQVAKSFEEQLLFGSRYSFTYTHNPKNNPLDQFYYNGTLDLAGNLINAIYNIAGAPFGGVSTTPSNLGNELDLIATYQANKNLTFQLGYFHFWYGDAVSSNPNALVADRNDANQIYFLTNLNF